LNSFSAKNIVVKLSLIKNVFANLNPNTLLFTNNLIKKKLMVIIFKNNNVTQRTKYYTPLSTPILLYGDIKRQR
jgi:hypothetical protein